MDGNLLLIILKFSVFFILFYHFHQSICHLFQLFYILFLLLIFFYFLLLLLLINSIILPSFVIFHINSIFYSSLFSPPLFISLNSPNHHCISLIVVLIFYSFDAYIFLLMYNIFYILNIFLDSSKD